MNILIETDRLILRELHDNDAPEMFEMDSDPKVHQFLGNQPISTIIQSKAEIAFIRSQYLENGIGRWAVIEKETNRFVGWSGLKLIKETCNNHINYYDIGYRFLRKYWSKGYATESARAAINYGFEVLNAKEIIGIADLENASSINVLEKIGLKRIEIFDYRGKLHHWMRIEKRSDNSCIS